ncbi:MAG: 6-aminohexanoate hydrolase [Friedmanniella sp.]|nr:6-aminohexanoate hydrolase [Friedmanniella sp.]
MTDAQGISLGAFGLRLAARDLVKLGELYLHDGVGQGRQIVSREWVRQATSPSALEPRYGLLWWLYTWSGHRAYVAQGSEGHLLVVLPDQRAVPAITSTNHPELPMNQDELFPLITQVILPALPTG